MPQDGFAAVVETVNQERCYTVMKPVTTYRTVRQNCGRWVWQASCQQGPSLPRIVCDPCGRPKLCMVPGATFTAYRPVWSPNIVERQIPCTTWVRQVVKQSCPVQVCRYVPEVVVEKIPVRTCRIVREEVVEKIPVRTCRWVEETVETKIPVRTCRWVAEECVRSVPVRTCKMVSEVKTCRTPYCVTKQVPYTLTQRVSRCVPKQVPVTYTRYVAKLVPRQVAYEVCRIVPGAAYYNPNPYCNPCGITPSQDASGPTEHKAAKPEPEPEPEKDPKSDPNGPKISA